jgi:hypothetical protein
MRGLSGVWILVISIFVCAGCSSHPAQVASWSPWAEHQGGLAPAPQDSRASAALARLGNPCCPANGRPVRVLVLKTDRPCAYAWPTGTLFVTEGLLRILDDDELAGALAHEVGHLRDHAVHSNGAAIFGNGGEACECRADAAGCELLASVGLSPDLLACALVKVSDDPATSPAMKASLSSRVQHIRSLSEN